MVTHSSILAWKSHGQRSLAGYSLWGHKESDTTLTEHAHTHTPRSKSIKSPDKVQTNRHLLATYSMHGAGNTCHSNKSKDGEAEETGQGLPFSELYLSYPSLHCS